MKSEVLLIEFGQHLELIRKERGLTQEELAHIADLDRTYISGIERGKRNIGLINIFKLAKALQILPFELFRYGDH